MRTTGVRPRHLAAAERSDGAVCTHNLHRLGLQRHDGAPVRPDDRIGLPPALVNLAIAGHLERWPGAVNANFARLHGGQCGQCHKAERVFYKSLARLTPQPNEERVLV